MRYRMPRSPAGSRAIPSSFSSRAWAASRLITRLLPRIWRVTATSSAVRRPIAPTSWAFPTGGSQRDGYQLTVKGARHFNFADMAVLFVPAAKLQGALGTIAGDRGVAITRAYVRAFFDRSLKPIPVTPEQTLATGLGSSAAHLLQHLLRYTEDDTGEPAPKIGASTHQARFGARIQREVAGTMEAPARGAGGRSIHALIDQPMPTDGLDHRSNCGIGNDGHKGEPWSWMPS